MNLPRFIIALAVLLTLTYVPIAIGTGQAPGLIAGLTIAAVLSAGTGMWREYPSKHTTVVLGDEFDDESPFRRQERARRVVEEAKKC